ncbi:CotH kinase family protein [Candidatus Omnitrophota bacterium]
MGKRAALLSYLFCLILIGFYLEESGSFATLKNRLQDRCIPSAMLQYGPLGQLLRKIDLIKVIPNDYSHHFHLKKTQFDVRRSIFQRKRRIGIQLYSVDVPEANPENTPSSLVMDRKHLKGELPVLSISIDENDLYDPAIGLLVGKNVFKRGRDWEKPAYISYYANGRQLFTAGTGLRIHGGSSRRSSRKSYRLYFREIYGTDQFKPGVLFDKKSEPIKRLVMLIDTFKVDTFMDGKIIPWGLRNSLAFDIAREIGCIAPQTEPARVFLNGTPQGLYFITEYLDENYLRSHYGHDNFLFYKEEGRGYKKKDLYRIARGRLRELKGQLTMEKVGKYFDIENLSRWLVSVLFCGTYDAFQGMIVLDKTMPSSKIFWINWDMNRSFRESPKRWKKSWEERVPKVIKEGKAGGHVQGLLLERLIEEDSQFRKYLERLFMEVLNHKLTSKFLESRIDYYEKVNVSCGINNTDFVERARCCLKHRPEFIRKMMQKHMGSDESYSCTVKGPKGIAYEIDGFSSRAPYHGWYFKGSTVEIKIVSYHKKSFSHWLINGSKVIKDKDLIYQVNSETAIEPILKEAALNKL